MPNSSETCPACLKPKTSTSGGFVTQFVDVCRCGQVAFADKQQVTTITVCRNCNKVVSQGRSGSLTQWIFRPDYCQCEKPEPVFRSGTLTYTSTAPRSFADEDDDGEQLELDPKTFPVERYQPKRRLGSGASGTVYLSRDRLLGKRVAVKLLHELSPQQLIAFQEEAKTTSKLHHPNIIQILDFGPTESGLPYMVLEYVERAESLEQLIARNGPLEPSFVLAVCYRICGALAHAHESGIFHRDLKPSNILLADTENGAIDVKLIDFGIAKSKFKLQDPSVDQGATIAGTPAYMAPEVAEGAGFEARSEIYSLGCVMYEALTGRQAFIGETSLEVIAMHVKGAPPRLSDVSEALVFPTELEDLFARCVAKKVDNRFSDIGQLRVAIENTANEILSQDVVEGLGGVTGTFNANDLPPSARKPSGIISGTTILLVAIGLVCVTTLALFWSTGKRADDSNDSNSVKLTKTPEYVGVLSEHIRDDLPSQNAFVLQRGKLAATGPIGDRDLAYAARTYKGQFSYLDLSSGSIEGQVNITHEGWKIVSRMPLTKINLQRSSVRDEDVELISKIKTLDFIDVSDTSITDKSIDLISKLPLRDLNLQRCIYLTDRCAPMFTKFSDLRLLSLSATELTDKSLPDIARLRIATLRLGYLAITDKGLAELDSNKTIDTLSVGSTKIGAAGIRSIKHMNLRSFDAGSCKNFDDECLKVVVTQWPNLEDFSCENTLVTRRGLRILSKFKNLKRLSLANLHLKDDDLAAIQNLPVLYLNLLKNDITDGALKYVLKNQRLGLINIGDCPNVTAYSVRVMRARGIQVTHNTLLGGVGSANKETFETLMAPEVP